MKQLIQSINKSPFKVYLAITGGGQTFIGDYMKVSGASNTIVGAIVPYSNYVFDKFVRGNNKGIPYASEAAARKLAVAAYNQCLEAGVESKYAVGLSATCSLAKDDERVGRVHKVHVAAHTRNLTYVINGEWVQGASREEEEFNVSQVLFWLLSRVTVDTHLVSLPVFDKLSIESINGSSVSDLLENPMNTRISFGFDDTQAILALYPGSFNPIHKAHREIYELSKSILGAYPLLELSVDNADKGQLDAIEVRNRIRDMSPYPFVLTNAPTFVKKVEVFKAKFPDKQLVFIVGADTWSRIWQPEYAGDEETVSQCFHDNKVKFLIFGRGDWRKTVYSDLIITDERASNFNNPISSTELRNKQYAKQ